MSSIDNILKRLRESRLNEEAINKEFRYTFQIPWRQVIDYGDEDNREYTYDPRYMEYANDIMDAALDEFNYIDWTDYIPYDRRTEHSGIKSMEMSFSDKGECFINVATKIELEDDQIYSLADYLSGQMSDGWGEGFEQKSIAHFKYETQEYDEDEEEYFTAEKTAQVYGEFWWVDSKDHPYDIHFFVKGVFRVEESKESDELDESTEEEFIERDNVAQEILQAIKSKVSEVMQSSDFGFDENDVEEYSVVEVNYQTLHDEKYIVVEVRAEVSYEGLEELSDELNPIVASYDKNAYFEPVTSGIIEAYISEEEAMKEDIEESKEEQKSEYLSSLTKEVMRVVYDEAPGAIRWRAGDSIRNNKTDMKATFKGYKKDALGRLKAILDHEGEEVAYSLRDLQDDIMKKVLVRE